MTNRIVPPQPARLLYHALFEHQERRLSLARLSEGLKAVAANSRHLLVDARLLADAQRYARAGFLVATAEEEIAKAFILLDMCRLDFVANEGQLRRLCRAFYDHVEKYAYYHTLRFNRDVPRRPFRDLNRIGELFQTDLRRWWPAGFESGEPDMPHDTYFTREANLYVDFSDYDQAWSVPDPGYRGFAFDQILGVDALGHVDEMLGGLEAAIVNRLFEPEPLGLLNEVFRTRYITDEVTSEDLWRSYDVVAERIEREVGIEKRKVLDSPLISWPLYHFLQARPS